MDVANMLSQEPLRPLRSQQASEVLQLESQRPHQYATRHSATSNGHQPDGLHALNTNIQPRPDNFSPNARANYSVPPSPHPPKNVAFELLFDDRTNYRARLPMRVQIFPHDTTDSIVTTVKNFYGLYEGTAKGVSFEDEQGNTLIARYENFRNEMIVYVRVIPDYSQNWQPNDGPPSHIATPTSAQRTPHLEAGFEMLPPQPAHALTINQPTSRPPSRAARKQSASPGLGGNRRSQSVQKSKPRLGPKTREDGAQAHIDDNSNEAFKEYSSSDGEGGSVTSSRKARNEQLASAEISLENIVEGGRRQRAKFESSELPLFVPPQVPATNSISSISPQRRSNIQDNASPFALPVHRSLSYNQPLPSPQSHGFMETPPGFTPASVGQAKSQADLPHNHRLRDRVSAPGPLTRLSSGLPPRVPGVGILPTPDPTIASCISDEDVALQLMRLGDASNFSTHGRTSASTQDDTLSGRADIASSASSGSDDEQEEDDVIFMQKAIRPAFNPKLISKAKANAQRQHGSITAHSGSADASAEDDEDDKDDDANFIDEAGHPAKRLKLSTSRPLSTQAGKARIHNIARKSNKPLKAASNGMPKKIKTSISAGSSKTAMSPPSIIPQSGKVAMSAGMTQHHQLPMEDDLSTKPRCQRCRKSKKGCDRQRPCQRCKDAGIGIEGCVSEDEGNGRKGRFGRHMGVSVKKDQSGSTPNTDTEDYENPLDGTLALQDKGKKRKRI